MNENNLTEVSETTEVVSNEQPETTSGAISTPEEWVAPSKEEYDVALKSAENRAKTEILKELGVKSIKEFKQSTAEINDRVSKFESLETEYNEYKSKLEEAEGKISHLTEQRALDKFGVKDDYRDDLLTLAKAMNSENIEAALESLVQEKYSYTVNQSSPVKMGTEKHKEARQSELSSETLKKYP